MSLDGEEIASSARNLPLFSRNRFNAVSFHDKDYGRGDGSPSAGHACAILAEAGLEVKSFARFKVGQA